MRIVISSPPKTGNEWLKCLLSTIYDLERIAGDQKAESRLKPSQIPAWIEAGGFKDGWIFHQHCRYSKRIVAAIAAAPAHSVTIIRDPYDQFVSMYYWVQTLADEDVAANNVRRAKPRDVMIGKPLDDPAVIDFLATAYGRYLQNAINWVYSGKSVVFRYEELHRDPVAALTQGTDQIASISLEKIKSAIDTCSADNMRKLGPKMARHVRVATVGDSKQRLNEVHLSIFRERHQDLVRMLGYEVR